MDNHRENAMTRGSSETTTGLKPTLWRTCRVLANRTRLHLLRELLRLPGQTVSELAVRLRLGTSVASRYLRDLNARGLLEARRVGRAVSYYPAPDPSVPQAAPLLAALQNTLTRHSDPVPLVFRLATTFTHPRRIILASLLKKSSHRLVELRLASGISENALLRHLAKLKSRGFVRHEDGLYSLQPGLTPLAETLLKMVDVGPEGKPRKDRE